MPKLSPSDAFPWPTYDVDLVRLLADHDAVVRGGSSYRLGGKAAPARAPGRVDAIDCSGYVRYLLARRGVPIVDGSQSQREWALREGLKRSDPGSCEREDGVLRLAVLPTTISRRVGHVVLTLDGRTIESHGEVGPDRRAVRALPWMDECACFVLARAKA